MTDPRTLSIHDFTYDLPDHRIALHPLPERDASRLLIYRNGEIQTDVYRNLAAYVPAGSLVVFNNTRVIQARMRFRKSTGGLVEIFCLEPVGPITDYSHAMSQTGSVTWKCFVGQAAKWKDELVTGVMEQSHQYIRVQARKLERTEDAYIIELSWQPAELSFAEILEIAGDIPLPPYIKRQTEGEDKERYQTIYAQEKGSVAAPTAGLHFTDRVMDALRQQGNQMAYVTLHVGAGTFKPVKAEQMQEHHMHAEWMDVHPVFIQNLIDHKGMLVAVGTTSLRTLESLYWMGVKALLHPDAPDLTIRQWEVYEAPLLNQTVSLKEALSHLLSWMKLHQKERLFVQTQILIAPGYRFRVAQALVTNFHQPQSTLLLLVAAAVGDDWRRIYAYALENDFRFLSYGDGSLLFMAES
jgi:S-adenosylmethionine:tRNA ribosyltransferase-isomerase